MQHRYATLHCLHFALDSLTILSVSLSHSRLSVGRPLRASGKVRANIPYKHAFHVTKILTINKSLFSHCRRACKESRTKRGPITIRTPNGLGVEEWAAGLEKYAKMYQNLDGVDNYDIKK